MAEPMEPGGTPPKPKPAPTTAPKPVTKTPAQKAAEAEAKKKAAADAAKKKAAADAAAKKAAETTAAETAASFGWSIAFFNSIPELKALIAKATKDGWSPARFTAALQGTKWFRNTSESSRKYQTLLATDPASFKQQIAAGEAHVSTLAANMGAGLSPSQIHAAADMALRLGWNEDQIKGYLANRLSAKGGNYTGGQAATFQSQFRSIAEDYGVSVSQSTLSSWVRSAVQGGQDTNSFKAMAQNLAASKYVALADRIRGGETVRQIADPYIQTYGKLLEVNADNLNLDDPLIQRALQAKDAKGKPTTQTVYDFENTLRNDPRWAKTDNARDQMSAAANSILQSFGLAG